VPGSRTRDALLEHGALLFASHGITGVTTRQLHDAIGARNESALHYHFSSREGLLDEILRLHLEAIEARRAPLVAVIAADGREADLRALVHALAVPMAQDLDTPVGRAHLRLVAHLSHPSLAYGRSFLRAEASAGRAVARWLSAALAHLPPPIRTERLVALRSQLISLFALRAQLLDEPPSGHEITPTDLFVHNLLDLLVAGLSTEPSTETLAAMTAR
jgi:AcrR family transcriptional regulator